MTSPHAVNQNSLDPISSRGDSHRKQPRGSILGTVFKSISRRASRLSNRGTKKANLKKQEEEDMKHFLKTKRAKVAERRRASVMPPAGGVI